MELKDFSELKALRKKLSQEEKSAGDAARTSASGQSSASGYATAGRASADGRSSASGRSASDSSAASTSSMPTRKGPKPDGSDATVDDYFPNGDAFIEDKTSFDRLAVPYGKKAYRNSGAGASAGTSGNSVGAGSASGARHVLPDGSNATAEDYFAAGDPFAKDADVKSLRSSKSSRKSSRYVTVDLHIEKLTHPSGLKESEYLRFQMSAFRATMEKYRRQKGKKIIFIHGYGAGVLREAILKAVEDEYWPSEAVPAPTELFGTQGAVIVTIA